MTRVLAFLEAATITGPAKNLLAFHREQMLAAHPVELEVATFHRGAPDNALTQAAEAQGIPVHRIAESFPLDARVLPRIRDLLRRRDPGIVQTHAVKSHFLLWLTGEWKRRPWIAFHHGYTFPTTRQQIYNRLDRWSLPRAQRVITVSQAFARDLVALGVRPERIAVLHNAIDPAWGDHAAEPAARAAARAQLGLLPDEKALLVVGRLSREKAHGDVIQALADLRQRLPGVALRLLIAGVGPERPGLEEAARAAGCLERIVFAGHVMDVLPYYAAADVAVLPSRTEGSPNALLEAMSARIPVVATRVGGIPEIVEHGETALLVPPADVPALTQALAETLAHPDEAAHRAQRAYSVLIDRHSPQRRVQFLLDLYAATARRTA